MRLRTKVACLLIVITAIAIAASNENEQSWIGNRRNWWSLQKPVRPVLPPTKTTWIRTPIDAFIYDALAAQQLTPSPALHRQRLIRRVTLDLTGLPPAPADVDAFLR